MLPDGRVHSSSPGLAVVNAAVGGALYVTAGGCKIAGCPTNTRCNVVTERCDPVKCGKNECKADEVCDEKVGECMPFTTTGARPSTSTNTPPVPAPPVGPNANPALP